MSDFKTVLVACFIAITTIAIVGLVVDGIRETGDAKRAELRNCIDREENSVLECRLAVYGRIGR